MLLFKLQPPKRKAVDGNEQCTCWKTDSLWRKYSHSSTLVGFQVVLVVITLVSKQQMQDVQVPSLGGEVPWRRHGNPPQYSCLENPHGQGAWGATVHGVSRSWTWLKWLSRHSCTLVLWGTGKDPSYRDPQHTSLLCFCQNVAPTFCLPIGFTTKRKKLKQIVNADIWVDINSINSEIGSCCGKSCGSSSKR